MDDGTREYLWFAVPDDTAKLARKLHRSLRQAQRFTAWPCRLLSLSAAQARRGLQPASLQIVTAQRFSTHRQLAEKPAGPRARGQGRACDSAILCRAAASENSSERGRPHPERKRRLRPDRIAGAF